jgi:hypothetical protein
MEHHNSDISLDSSEVLLSGDPMFPALGIVNENKDIVQTAFETVSQTQQPAPDLLDLSSTFSYSSSNFVLGTPSTSYNNNNNRSFHTMKPPDISSPYFSQALCRVRTIFQDLSTLLSTRSKTSLKMSSINRTQRTLLTMGIRSFMYIT